MQVTFSHRLFFSSSLFFCIICCATQVETFCALLLPVSYSVVASAPRHPSFTLANSTVTSDALPFKKPIPGSLNRPLPSHTLTHLQKDHSGDKNKKERDVDARRTVSCFKRLHFKIVGDVCSGFKKLPTYTNVACISCKIYLKYFTKF